MLVVSDTTPRSFEVLARGLQTLVTTGGVLVVSDTTSRSFEELARGLQTSVTTGADRMGWVFFRFMGLGLVIGAARV